MLQAGAVAAGTGIAGFAAQRAGVLDNGLRAIGIRPHTEPDPRDVALLSEAATGQAELLAALDQVGPTEDAAAVTHLRAVLREQLAAVSDDPSPSPGTGSPAGNGSDVAGFADQVEAAAAARADGAVSAGSLAVAKVLAAMSAGLEQVAVVARRLA
jgi:hypothetical protein